LERPSWKLVERVGKEETKAQNETAGQARGHGWKGMETRRQKDKTAAGRDES
jgi:hypothetical protein